MHTELPLVNDEFLMEKYPGKGGWTYIVIPSINQDKRNPFGWVKVKGTIDGFELSQYKLMPMGNGRLFLPVRAEIRKKIKKEAGDYVQVTLFADDSVLEIPEEIMECFQNEPVDVLHNFKALPEGQQKVYLDWIYSAKRNETKASRILKMMSKLQRNLRLHDEDDLMD